MTNITFGFNPLFAANTNEKESAFSPGTSLRNKYYLLEQNDAAVFTRKQFEDCAIFSPRGKVKIDPEFLKKNPGLEEELKALIKDDPKVRSALRGAENLTLEITYKNGKPDWEYMRIQHAGSPPTPFTAHNARKVFSNGQPKESLKDFLLRQIALTNDPLFKK